MRQQMERYSKKVTVNLFKAHTHTHTYPLRAVQEVLAGGSTCPLIIGPQKENSFGAEFSTWPLPQKNGKGRRTPTQQEGGVFRLVSGGGAGLVADRHVRPDVDQAQRHFERRAEVEEAGADGHEMFQPLHVSGPGQPERRAWQAQESGGGALPFRFPCKLP